MQITDRLGRPRRPRPFPLEEDFATSAVVPTIEDEPPAPPPPSWLSLYFGPLALDDDQWVPYVPIHVEQEDLAPLGYIPPLTATYGLPWIWDDDVPLRVAWSEDDPAPRPCAGWVPPVVPAVTWDERDIFPTIKGDVADDPVPVVIPWPVYPTPPIPPDEERPQPLPAADDDFALPVVMVYPRYDFARAQEPEEAGGLKYFFSDLEDLHVARVETIPLPPPGFFQEDAWVPAAPPIEDESFWPPVVEVIPWNPFAWTYDELGTQLAYLQVIDHYGVPITAGPAAFGFAPGLAPSDDEMPAFVTPVGPPDEDALLPTVQVQVVTWSGWPGGDEEWIQFVIPPPPAKPAIGYVAHGRTMLPGSRHGGRS